MKKISDFRFFGGVEVVKTLYYFITVSKHYDVKLVSMTSIFTPQALIIYHGGNPVESQLRSPRGYTYTFCEPFYFYGNEWWCWKGMMGVWCRRPSQSEIGTGDSTATGRTIGRVVPKKWFHFTTFLERSRYGLVNYVGSK